MSVEKNSVFRITHNEPALSRTELPVRSAPGSAGLCTLPEEARAALGAPVYLTLGPAGRSLALLSAAEWETLQAGIAQQVQNNPNVGRQLRWLLANTACCPAEDGVLALPPVLLEYAHIRDTAVLVRYARGFLLTAPDA